MFLNLFIKGDSTDFCIVVECDGLNPVYFHCHLLFLISKWTHFSDLHLIKDTQAETIEKLTKMKGKKKIVKNVNSECVRSIIHFFYSGNIDVFKRFNGTKNGKELLKAIIEMKLEKDMPLLYSHLNVKDLEQYWYSNYTNDRKSEIVVDTFDVWLREILNTREKLLKDCMDSLSDVSLLIEDKTMNGHKLVLQNCDYLKTLMSKTWGNSEKIVIDERIDLFQEIYKFLYSGKVDLNQDNAMELLIASNRLMVQEMQSLVEKYIVFNIDDENASKILVIAHSIGSTSLKFNTKKFIIQRLIGDAKKYHSFFEKELFEHSTLWIEIMVESKRLQNEIQGSINGDVRQIPLFK